MGSSHHPYRVVVRWLVFAAIVGSAVGLRAQGGSNPRYNSIALGPSTAQPAAATGVIRMPNGGLISLTQTSGHTFKIRAWNGSAWVDMMTVTNGATPTIAFDANMTVGGDPLLAVEDFGHDAILFFDNGSPDVANEVTIGSGLSFSGGTLSASMTPFHALAYGAMGAGLVRLVEVRLRRRRERALRRLAFDPTVFGTAVQRRAW